MIREVIREAPREAPREAIVPFDVGLEQARVALHERIQAHRARRVHICLRRAIRLEHAACAYHSSHPELLPVLSHSEGHAQRVVARLIVHDVREDAHALAEARVKPHAQLEHLAIRGYRLEDIHSAAESEAVQSVPAKVAAHIDDEAPSGAAPPDGLVPRERERRLEDELLPHALHVVVRREEGEREWRVGACGDRLDLLACRARPSIHKLGTYEAQRTLAAVADFVCECAVVLGRSEHARGHARAGFARWRRNGGVGLVARARRVNAWERRAVQRPAGGLRAFSGRWSACEGRKHHNC